MEVLQREGLLLRRERRGTFAQPRPISPASRRGRTRLRCITFVMPPRGFMNFQRASYLEGYTEALDHRQIRMRFVPLGADEQDYDRLLAPNLPPQTQGLVLINRYEPVLPAWLREKGLPFVIQHFALYPTSGLPEHHGVYVNKTGGAFEAVNHLIQSGHRRIGFFGGYGSSDAPSNRVFEGYCAALNCAGLDNSRDSLLYFAKEERSADVYAAMEIVQRQPRPTAIFAGNDTLALALLDAALALRIRVPEELSVVGMDNRAEAETSAPPLTTVSIPRRELAKGAVKLLLAAVEGGRPPGQRVLEYHLIVRKSTAPRWT